MDFRNDCAFVQLMVVSWCSRTMFFLVRYASLRRRLLIEPLVSKDGTNSPNLVIDNPLSQNPGKSKLFLLYFSTLLGVKSLT